LTATDAIVEVTAGAVKSRNFNLWKTETFVSPRLAQLTAPARG